LNGHSDVVAGAVVAARDDSFWQRIRAWRRDAGAIMGPFEAWLLLRGMRTLFVRVRRCCETAQAVAAHFEGHPAIRQVLYPGLVSHAGHAVASRQMVGGYGGMLSLRLVNGEAAAMATAANLKVFKRATSLGGVESLVEHRASIEGPSTPVPTDLLRFSMGLEDAQDLIADLEAALAEAEKVQGAVRVQDIVRQAYDPSANVAEKVGWVLTHYIRPLVLERGGDLELRVVVDGAVIFGVVGSPGASLPLRGNIQALLSHYVPQINRVEFTTVGDESDAAAVEIAAIAQDGARIEEVISKSINPALAGHGGLIELDRVEGKDVYLLFGGRCQGCAMANLTFRQGVEVMLKRAIPDMASVIDATDHTLGTDPYFKTKKA
ncbi:MAG: hypothetical protein HOI95_14180, partial [Chromatiales bacterium]|nr:hypothetical protein [Chromatiales bacterium]